MGLNKEELEAKLAELEDNEQNKEERAQLQRDLDELLKGDGDDKGSPGSGSGDDGDGDGDKKGPGWIPKFRYDSAAQRARKAEQERDEALKKVKELTEGSDTGAGQQQPGTQDKGGQGQSVDEWLAEADTKYANLMAEGKAEEAARLMAEIRKVERSAITAYFQDQVANVSTEATEAASLDRYIDQIEQDFPQLNPDDKAYDKDLAETVLEVYEGLVQRGDRTPTESMARALEIVIKDEVQGGDGDGGDDKAGLRRNLDASRRQAPGMGDHGHDSDKKGQKGTGTDVRELTDEEFDALPESKKQQLRGDFV